MKQLRNLQERVGQVPIHTVNKRYCYIKINQCQNANFTKNAETISEVVKAQK